MSVYLQYCSLFVQMKKVSGSDADAVRYFPISFFFFNLPLRWFLTDDYLNISKVKVNSVPNKPPADVVLTRKSHNPQIQYQFNQLRLLFWKNKACFLFYFRWHWFEEFKFVIRWTQSARASSDTNVTGSALKRSGSDRFLSSALHKMFLYSLIMICL